MLDLAAGEGRTLRLGHAPPHHRRDTAEEAWAEAQRILEGMDPAPSQPRRSASPGWSRSARPGWQPSTAAARSPRDRAEPLGRIGLVREGAGTALVGSHEEVAERIDEYRDLGIDEFILSGYPHLEEAYRVGESVLSMISRPRSVS